MSRREEFFLALRILHDVEDFAKVQNWVGLDHFIKHYYVPDEDLSSESFALVALLRSSYSYAANLPSWDGKLVEVRAKLESLGLDANRKLVGLNTPWRHGAIDARH